MKYKIKALFTIFKNIYVHPLNKEKRLRAYFRFFKFQIFSRLTKKSFVFNWIDDSQLIINIGDHGFTGNYYYGIEDYKNILFMLKSLPDDTVFVDVGANLGSYSIAASKVRGLKTYSFEPVKNTFNKLRSNIEFNDIKTIIKLFNCALGSSAGVIKFLNNQDSMNRIYDEKSDSGKEIELVKIEKLDNLLSINENYFLKIDTEGNELNVLKGSNILLERNCIKGMIIENNQDSDLIHQLLSSQGFYALDFNPFKNEITVLENYNSYDRDTIYVKDLKVVEYELSLERKFNLHHIVKRKI